MSDNQAPRKYDLARKLFAILSEEGGMAVVGLVGFKKQFTVRVGVTAMLEFKDARGGWEPFLTGPVQFESVEPYREPWHVSVPLRNLFELGKLLAGAPEGAQLRIDITEVI